jgi:hypothetical protein
LSSCRRRSNPGPRHDLGIARPDASQRPEVALADEAQAERTPAALIRGAAIPGAGVPRLGPGTRFVARGGLAGRANLIVPTKYLRHGGRVPELTHLPACPRIAVKSPLKVHKPLIGRSLSSPAHRNGTLWLGRTLAVLEGR